MQLFDFDIMLWQI